MILKNPRKLHALLATVALLSQLCGLIFCGDIDCLKEGSEETCTTLWCGLFAKHASAAQASDNLSTSSCQCFCHLLIDLPKITLQAALNVAHFHTAEISHFFSTPIYDIYHPPLA